ncbi:MAG TPA: hypothetical protein VGR14_15830 [Verrucomicrobiae bacterium]|jgi:hypothetical protein|nr:hypothetical protein [Verrucomicrobiae bacterium]
MIPRERDFPGRRGVRLAPRFGMNETNWDVFSETPNTATVMVALSKHQHMREISETFLEINELHKGILEYQALEQHMNAARSMGNIDKYRENQRLA